MTNFEIEHNRLLGDLKVALSKDMARLSVDANGGRCILFVYSPHDEERYVAEAKKRFPDGCFIDLRRLLVDFVDSIGMDDFKEIYDNFGKEIFKSSNFPQNFYNYIMAAISDAYVQERIPFLIHTGTIYEMGFSNLLLMENEIVIKSPIPLVVFYPATIEGDKILFLGRSVASQYRCIVLK